MHAFYKRNIIAENLLNFAAEKFLKISLYYTCCLSTATIEYSYPSVCLSVCASVYTITKK